MRIRILDPVDVKILEATKEELAWLKKLLSHKSTFFIRKQYGSERKEYNKTHLWKVVKVPGWYFPTGFLSRVIKAALVKGIDLVVEDNPKLLPHKDLNVPGVTFRPDQIKLIEVAVTQQRGILVSPMGSGKTWILMGILSCFPEAKILVLTHSTSIVKQTRKEFVNHGFTLSEGLNSARIMVTTRQAVSGPENTIKEKFKAWMQDLDVLVVDEVHLFGKDGGQYSKIFRSTVAPVRLGLTGTEPKEGQVAMTVEGMVGPVIGKLDYEEAKELEILADTKLELVPVPIRSSLKVYKTYKDIHRFALVKSRARNQLVMEKAQDLMDRGLTVLIFIQDLEHGKHLSEMAEILGIESVFIRGATKDSDRDLVKKAIMDGKARCVISSKIWREGVNIPNLGAVILAGGGKAELSTLQHIGRGLRRTEEKNQAVVVDFLDPYRYLAEHTIQRLGVYAEKGWL